MADHVPGALGALLHEIVDYAGLFPPAGLSMPDAVRAYAAHRAGSERWMLGRFVVHAARLDEFIAAMAPLQRAAPVVTPWRLSVLVGPDTESDIARVVEFNASGDGAVVDAVEARAASVGGVERLAAVLPRGLHAYVEVPLGDDTGALVAAVATARLRAKARTGGVTHDLVPTPTAMARFLAACARHDVAFKVTAGLHHPLRADYPLTYAPDSPRATMFGFVNVFMAAALAHEGATEDLLERVLRETGRDAFHFDDDAARWRDCQLPTATIAHVRASFAIAFGSCSFREPVEELGLAGRPLLGRAPAPPGAVPPPTRPPEC